MAVDVMVYLKEVFVLEYERGKQKAVRRNAAGCSTFLKITGYKRGKRTTSTYHSSTKNVIVRDPYMQQMQQHIRSTHRPYILYTDESYIHQKSTRAAATALTAAILDSPTLQSKVLVLDIFTGGTTAAKAPKDYHSMFNHVYYVKWLEGLLDELDGEGVSNAFIPIETVWAIVKNAIGRQYTEMTKFPEVKARLIDAFDNLTQ
ncbi:hypothetical protein B5M09_004748 [Aphanomyces astaci]|uniref:Uncharacterized protein n=1 Tax=Aphanomyces astaci TaxID=112090 RepID=A0A3R7WIV7_APHAT|nr:hypothetical protein B5M09_004748 [Aphanomyces astaci]